VIHKKVAWKALSKNPSKHTAISTKHSYHLPTKYLEYQHAITTTTNLRTDTTSNKPHRMSLLPTMPSSQNYNIMFDQHHSDANHDKATFHYTLVTPLQHHNIRHHFSSFLNHMFAPISCQQCTSTSQSPYRIQDYPARIIVDDEFVLLEEDSVDGGPLCREATIASWKVMTKNRKRRLSVHCFGGE
jgi:hypothetical protein